MGIVCYCLSKIPLCHFGIAHSHAICVIVKYFGELSWKTIGRLNPLRFSIDGNYPGTNRNLKLPNGYHIMSVINHVLSVALGCLVRIHKVLYTFLRSLSTWSRLLFLLWLEYNSANFDWSTIAPNDSHVDQSNIYQGSFLFWHVLVCRRTEEFWFYILCYVE